MRRNNRIDKTGDKFLEVDIIYSGLLPAPFDWSGYTYLPGQQWIGIITMLGRLINEINRLHTMDSNILASALATSPQMIESMLSTLVQMGLIKSLDTCDSSNCNGCQVNALCSPKIKPVIWQVGKSGEK